MAAFAPTKRLILKAISMRFTFLLVLLAFTAVAVPQTSAPTPDAAQSTDSAPAQPQGKVLFSRHQDPESSSTPDNSPATEPTPPETAAPQLIPRPDQTPKPATTPPDPNADFPDDIRNSLTFTAYDLDVHLVPAQSQLAVHARISVQNTGTKPLTQIALQISSSLTWESLAIEQNTQSQPVAFVQHKLDTDADHTGQASEAILTLPTPLAPGATLHLTALYSGPIEQSANRLERIGAPPEQAALADWDKISPDGTYLRGFGDVLWYPASAAPVFLGEGNKLFEAVGRARLNQSAATIRLHLSIAYIGDAPDAAFFCGRRQPLTAVSENQDTPVAIAPGIATADFPAQPLGFRTPSLFVTDHAATTAGGQNDTLISAVTDHYDALPSYAAAADRVKPILSEWLGATPIASLQILDHPGQPFEDDTLVVAPLRAIPADTLAPSLIHSLSHAWFRSSHIWLDEGIPQFMSLLYVERTQSRDAAIALLQQPAAALALVEPESKSDPDTIAPGQSLLQARDDIYYRNKAADVLWMLRAIVGDEVLKQALQTYRTDAQRNPKIDADPKGFQTVLEQVAQKNLSWFFDDWVNRDRGLPDLQIAGVHSDALPVRPGKPAGNLVAVEVHNDGDAVAEVPVTVRSGTLTATERVRVLARSSASTRIVFEGNPDEIQLNDGTIPESGPNQHTRQIVVTSK